MATHRAPMSQVRAWRPDVAGVDEVFHASFVDHAYPMHTHASWTVLIIDAGAVRYALDRREHGALTSLVTLLPPHVPHDGRAAVRSGFRKRVLYLAESLIDADLIGPAVDRPELVDPVLRDRIARLHDVLARPDDPWEADSRLALVREQLIGHLCRVPAPAEQPDHQLARRLRDLLDDHIDGRLTLAEAGRQLGADPTHLIRVFGARYGLPPHRYLTGRRIDRARRLLLAGVPITETATRSGFFDQSHLHRHFRALLGTTPHHYAGLAAAARR